MQSLAHHLDTCLAALGTDDFAPAFADFVEALGVDQVMIFAVEADSARCLMSRNFGERALGGKLAETYLDGWYRRDPLLPGLLAAPVGSVRLHRLDEIEARMDAAYRRIFFAAPGLGAKTTVAAVGATLRLFVSLYRSGAPGEGEDPDLARLAGRLALLHFERGSDGGVPAPLAVLSARERDVCLGILSGRTADAIAREVGIAPSTVVTYRKRAYDKLGVTSRAGLFAICRG